MLASEAKPSTACQLTIQSDFGTGQSETASILWLERHNGSSVTRPTFTSGFAGWRIMVLCTSNQRPSPAASCDFSDHDKSGRQLGVCMVFWFRFLPMRTNKGIGRKIFSVYKY